MASIEIFAKPRHNEMTSLREAGSLGTTRMFDFPNQIALTKRDTAIHRENLIGNKTQLDLTLAAKAMEPKDHLRNTPPQMENHLRTIFGQCPQSQITLPFFPRVINQSIRLEKLRLKKSQSMPKGYRISQKATLIDYQRKVGINTAPSLVQL